MKKGFTLVEVIAVIVVLALIMLFSFPAINNTIKKEKLNQQNQEIKNIYMAVETYLINNNLYDSIKNPGNEKIIFILDLIKDGYVKNDAKNPKNDLDFTNKKAIKVVKQTDNTLKYYNNFSNDNIYEE